MSKNKKPISSARTGDVICADRGLYRHYGVYDGGKVIDISPADKDNSLANKHKAYVRKKSLNNFLDGCSGFVDNSPGLHSRKKTVERARREIGTGRNSYDLLSNNCEHKAREWQTGYKQSNQVDEALANVVSLAIKIGDMFSK